MRRRGSEFLRSELYDVGRRCEFCTIATLQCTPGFGNSVLIEFYKFYWNRGTLRRRLRDKVDDLFARNVNI